MKGQSQTTKIERVWDPLVRLFHWSLVAAFITAWFGRGEAWLHEGAGKFVLVLILIRVVWGIIGTGAARFETFIRGPHATLTYVYDILRGRPAHFQGHNPAGAAMIALMLVTLVVTTASGILMTTTKLWGNGTVEFVHGQSANLMLVLIVAHLLGVIVASLQHRENLIFSMVSGWKQVPVDTLPYLGGMKWSLKRLFASAVIVTVALGIWQLSTIVLNASFWRMEKIFLAAAKDAGCNSSSVGSPTIIIYPRILVQYQIENRALLKNIVVNLDGLTVLQKKSKSNFPEIIEACEQIALDFKQKTATQFALRALQAMPISQPKNSDADGTFASAIIPWPTPTLPPLLSVFDRKTESIVTTRQTQKKQNLAIAKRSISTGSTVATAPGARTNNLVAKKKSVRKLVEKIKLKQKKKRKAQRVWRLRNKDIRNHQRTLLGGGRTERSDDHESSGRSNNSGRGSRGGGDRGDD